MDSHFNYISLDCHFIFALRASENCEGIEFISWSVRSEVIYSSSISRIMKGVALLEEGSKIIENPIVVNEICVWQRRISWQTQYILNKVLSMKIWTGDIISFFLWIEAIRYLLPTELGKSYLLSISVKNHWFRVNFNPENLFLA